MPLKAVLANLTTTEEQLEKWSISPDEEVYNQHLAIGDYSFPYCLTTVLLLGVPDCMPSGNSPLLCSQGGVIKG